jgi:four helix bundle protein
MLASFKDLRVWREAMGLAVAIYKGTESFPKQEIYGLTNQMRRAAVSVASNIAEGKGHHSDREFCNFLFHARGSVLELQTQIMISKELGYLSDKDAGSLLERADSVARGLNALINSLSGRGGSKPKLAVITGQRPTTND